jgi:integrase
MPPTTGRNSAVRLNFTKASLGSLLDGFAGRQLVHDTKQPGLVAEIRSAKVLTFYLYKRIQGPPTKIRIGRFPEMTVDQARTQCVKLLGKIAEGKNPATERRAARVEHTLGALFDHWLETHAKQHRRTWPEDKRQFDKHLASWRSRRLSSIRRSDVQALHVKLGTSSGEVTANRILALLRALFNKAERIGFNGDNPAARVQRFSENSRDRFLRPEELPAFWQSLAQEPELFQDFFMMALLTGARRRNVQTMRWVDVHLDGAIWRIPHTKNNEPLLVHLPAKAVEILRRRRDNNRSSEWVFPTRAESGHLEEPKTAWKRVVKRAGLQDIRIHDLRRTLGSWQALQGVSLPIIGKSLGHKSLKATQVYSRLTMAPVIEAVDRATTAMLSAGKRRQKSERIFKGK